MIAVAANARGRSPLTRGRLEGGPRGSSGIGSIPAHAGETNTVPSCSFLERVDPRSRGGDRSRLEPLQELGGRSPLTRGRPGHGAADPTCGRSIPAHAGETPDRPGWAWRGWVDPRSRGGDGANGRPLHSGEGRSPLTRGRRARTRSGFLPLRSIPAHAGETNAGPSRQNRQEVDPRSRGGDVLAGAIIRGPEGRSPLTRGRPTARRGRCAGWGSIPAHAGETDHHGRVFFSLRVDPRSRGGDCVFRQFVDVDGGRSPLTRGRHACSSVRGYLRGSIPAHAGETMPSNTLCLWGRVDPRSRGGDSDWPHCKTPTNGRSPLTRGRHHALRVPRTRLGSIPAHAGETRGLHRCGSA